MSEFTNQEVVESFHTREIDTVAVKGKADGVKIFEVRRCASGPALLLPACS